MPLAEKRLKDLVEHLRSRPGHEMVRSLVTELCTAGLDIPANEVDFEVPVPDVQGTVDALLGATVFEFKRDLRRERADAETQLTRYISERESATKRRYLGLACDGAEFVAYEVSDGKLARCDEHTADSDDPHALLRWLDKTIAVREDLPPDPQIVRDELGRGSLVYRRSMSELRQLWSDVASTPEAHLKRELWGQHLEFVYGTLIEPEELFLQHTYLTIVAKTMAVRALVSGPVPPGELLAGEPFTKVGLYGAVEGDFLTGFYSPKKAPSLLTASPTRSPGFAFPRYRSTS